MAKRKFYPSFAPDKVGTSSKKLAVAVKTFYSLVQWTSGGCELLTNQEQANHVQQERSYQTPSSARPGGKNFASIVSFSKALSALAAAGVLVSGCYGQYSYPTGAYPANYRYQTTYVAHPKVYYDYNQWPRLGYPYGGYGTQGIRY